MNRKFLHLGSFWSRALPLASLAALAPVASAQLPCGVPNIGVTAEQPAPALGLTEVWVDPINPSLTPAVNDRFNPFGTIGAAQNALVAAMSVFGPPGPLNRGIVHLNPGIYSLATNLEVFPIVMTEFVDIQGVGAKQCVLRGDGTQIRPFGAFFPWSDDTCTCGTPGVQAEVLVDFSFTDDDQYDEMIDSVTFQGGDVQVYAETEIEDIEGRVSNCVFDMLDNPFEGYAAPTFGVLMAHVYLGERLEYADIELNVFNNTFIQSWAPLPNGVVPVVSAADDSVAICDVNNPLCGSAFPDPNPTLRGVGNPNIQNNLIRAFDATPPLALMGIDAGDTTAAAGTLVGPTNAFDPGSVGGFAPAASPNGLTLCSTVTGALPVPVVFAGAAGNPNALTGGVDPAFVGEFLTSFTGGGIPFTHARDWRLLPDSWLVNQGSAPDAAGALSAVNGTAHVDLACAPQSSFDMDGEGWGNLRVEASALAAQPALQAVDIGYDEAAVLIDCAMANDSIVHTPATIPHPQFGPFNGLGFRVLLYPSSAAIAAPDVHVVAAVNQVPLSAYTYFPGSVGSNPAGFPPFTAPWQQTAVAALAPFDWMWLDPTAGLGLFTFTGGSLLRVPFVSVYDGTLHSVSAAIVPSSAATVGQPAQFAEQGVYFPAGGPNAGFALISNLQGVND